MQNLVFQLFPEMGHVKNVVFYRSFSLVKKESFYIFSHPRPHPCEIQCLVNHHLLS